MAPDEFAARYNEATADAIIALSAGMGGLPGYLGIEISRLEPGRLWATASLNDELITVSGNVHGGALAAILDHVTGVVVYPLMPEGSWAATTELKVNYIRPVQAGNVEALATVLAMTKRSAVVRGELRYGDKLACAVQGTLTLVGPRGRASPKEQSVVHEDPQGS